MNSRTNEVNAQKLNELSRQLTAVRRASQNIYDEVLQRTFVRGYYINNYKTGYDILKPILGQHLKWDISKRGRKSLTRDLEIYQGELTNQIQNKRTEIKADEKKWLEQNANLQINKKNVRTQLINDFLNKKATKIQKVIRNRIGKIYTPIALIPLNATKSQKKIILIFTQCSRL